MPCDFSDKFLMFKIYVEMSFLFYRFYTSLLVLDHSIGTDILPGIPPHSQSHFIARASFKYVFEIESLPSCVGFSNSSV